MWCAAYLHILFPLPPLSPPFLSPCLPHFLPFSLPSFLPSFFIFVFLLHSEILIKPDHGACTMQDTDMKS